MGWGLGLGLGLALGLGFRVSPDLVPLPADDVVGRGSVDDLAVHVGTAIDHQVALGHEAGAVARTGGRQLAERGGLAPRLGDRVEGVKVVEQLTLGVGSA